MSKNITIQLPDGSQKKYPQGVTAGDIVKNIGAGLAKAAVGALVNNEIRDLQTPIQKDSKIRILKEKDKETLDILRHSATHIMAQAIKRLYGKDVEITIGPVIENGYFYDFSFKKEFSEKDLERVEKEMAKIVKENHTITRHEMKRGEAVKFFKKQGENYKAEIIRDLNEDSVSIYEQGEFKDLCRGPHMPTTGKLKAFKLLKVAGAYWRGNEKNEMLTRVYGTAFYSQKELEEYLHLLEESKKRDHRKLGKDLDLFSFHEEAPGVAFFHEKGTILYELLLDYCRSFLKKEDYKLVRTPYIFTDDLWHQSGHYENYKENMYFTETEGKHMAIKPMNCPGHCLIYKNAKHSYRELPLRIAEFGFVHRYEKSGVLHGLMRLRGFAQDDAHIYCTEEHIEEEVVKLVKRVIKTYQDFEFKEYKIELSTRPEKSMGSKEMWDKAEKALENALNKLKIQYQLNPGDGAFYGPKIDTHIKDSLGRLWQCGTIQLDFSMPERFGLTYVGSDSEEHRPVMIHRAIFGSPDRFLGVLIEHFGGAFPVWLSPVQVVVLNLTDAQLSYATDVFHELKTQGFRVISDFRNEKLGFKIREAQLQKVPYMVIIGDKEVQSKKIALRERKGEQSTTDLDEFVERLKKESHFPRT
ncbi:MAG: threonine--tRNA ligase [Deltaproteobacteria bacterium]|nr:threonine--tRNA ligase [Deltaproteobacteria bacterium]